MNLTDHEVNTSIKTMRIDCSDTWIDLKVRPPGEFHVVWWDFDVIRPIRTLLFLCQNVWVLPCDVISSKMGVPSLLERLSLSLALERESLLQDRTQTQSHRSLSVSDDRSVMAKDLLNTRTLMINKILKFCYYAHYRIFSAHAARTASESGQAINFQ